ncbi:MAG TPA: hypothetical protein VFB58_16585 [Chloroflexota bacterium]|nr:hypothetical protein [Chloroflexota bacterium]
MHYPVVVARHGDQPGVVYAWVRLAGPSAGHDDPAIPLMHEPRQPGRRALRVCVVCRTISGMETSNKAELQKDLQAAVAARRELGPEMDDELIGAFLDRMQREVDRRVSEQVEQQVGNLSRRHVKRLAKGRKDDGIEGIIALAIPLMVIAGIFGHMNGIYAVVVGMVVIVLLRMVQETIIRA